MVVSAIGTPAPRQAAAPTNDALATRAAAEPDIWSPPIDAVSTETTQWDARKPNKMPAARAGKIITATCTIPVAATCLRLAPIARNNP